MVSGLYFSSWVLRKLFQLLCQGNWCPEDCVSEGPYVLFSILLPYSLKQKSSISAESLCHESPWTGSLHEKKRVCTAKGKWYPSTQPAADVNVIAGIQSRRVHWKFEYWHCMCWADYFQRYSWYRLYLTAVHQELIVRARSLIYKCLMSRNRYEITKGTYRMGRNVHWRR